MMNQWKNIFLMSVLCTFILVLVLTTPAQSNLNIGNAHLQDGRAYRKDFRITDTWKDIAEKYENTGAYDSLKAAMDDFKAELAIFPYSLEESEGLALSVNEIMQGQSLVGNQRLIEATSGDKRYFTNIEDDEFLLGQMLAEQRNGIEHALEAFDKGIIDGFTILREYPQVFRSQGEVDASVPKYLSFQDPVTWPTQPEQVILCEHAQLINALNRKSQAAEELGRTLYRIAERSNNLTQKENATAVFRKTAHHTYLGSLIMSATQNIEDFRENGGEQLKRRVVNNRRYFENVQAGLTPDGTDSYDVPFIPYENMANIKNDALTYVQNALIAAQYAQAEQRNYDHSLAALREELTRQRARYLDPIEQISDFDPENYNALETIGVREQFVADLEEKIDTMLALYATEKDTDEFKEAYINGFGELGPQILSVIRARIDADIAYEELQKIPEKIAIENQRAGKIAKIRKDNLKEYEALDVARGMAQSFVKVTTASYQTSSEYKQFKDFKREDLEKSHSAMVNDFEKAIKTAMEAAIQESPLSKSSNKKPKTTKTKYFTTSYTYDPTAKELRAIDSKERYLATMEQVDILNADSEALIRNLLLETGYKAKVLERSEAVYNQEIALLRTKLQQINNLIDGLWEDRQTAEDLYYNDPAYEVALTEAQEYAADMHKRAIDKLYTYAKSMEYYWAEPFEYQIRGWSCGMNSYVPSALDHYFTKLSDVFWLRTSYECHYFLNALNEWDSMLRNDQCARWLSNQVTTIAPDISLKNDMLNLRELPELEREKLFAEFIRNHRKNEDGDPLNPNLEFEFSITNKLLDDLIGDTWNRRISSISVRVLGEDGINGEYNIMQYRLAQGGCVNVKNFFQEIVSYNIQDKENPYGKPPFSFEAKARINVGFGTPVPGYPDEREFTKDILKGKPLAASKYTFTIDTGLAINRNIRFDKINDIQFRIVSNHDQPPVFASQTQP